MDEFDRIAYAELVRDVQAARGNTLQMARAVQRLTRYSDLMEARNGC